MATVMEKDVALEVIAATLALVSQKVLRHRGRLDLPPIEKELVALRNRLYAMPYAEVDFAAVLAFCADVRARYEGLADAADAPVSPEDIFDQWVYGLLVEGMSPVDAPFAWVLGGQPGAGKNVLIEKLLNEQLAGNAVVVNGDDFRRFDPNASALYAQYGADASRFTGEFAAKLVEMAIDCAVREGFNLIVEGTFRTAETPLKTLHGLQAAGYRTGVAMMVVSPEVSWASVNERYEKQMAAGIEARMTPRSHHDLVVDVLAANADRVHQEGGAERFLVYNREAALSEHALYG